MYDPSVFAVLIPANHMAQIAFALDHNAKYLVRAISGVAVNPPPSSRESTPAPQSPFDEVRDLFTGDTDPFVTVDRIVLHFSHMDDLIDPVDGIRFGTRPRSSDVLLGHLGTPGVSAHHFSIVVDDNLRVWLHDHSRYGCAVAYDGEGRDQTRRNDTWVLGYEPGHPRRWREVIVHVASGIAFRVEFPHHHEAAPPEYVTRLQAFRARCRGAAPSIGVLGLGGSSASTTAPSSARTPGNKAVYLDDGCIGKGAFGDVRRVIKARDGHVYALKKAFHREERGATNKRRRDSEQSRNEYDIMTMDPHPNIMPVLDYQDTPQGPIIVMPYYRMGSLEHYPINEQESVKVLLDVLQGLRHLHSRGIIHRDIKQANLLLDEPFNIVIADFGLSKFAVDQQFETFCGTPEYIAPEVFTDDTYGPKADIWSAGVVIAQLYLKFHDPSAASHEEWRRKLLEYVHEANENQDQVIEVLLSMLKQDPTERLTANECLELGLRNGLFEETSSGGLAVGDAAEAGSEGTATPRPRYQSGQPTCPSFQAGPGFSNPRSVLLANLWDDVGIDSGSSRWSLTIGLGHSDSDGGFGLTDEADDRKATGLIIRRDRFSASSSTSARQSLSEPDAVAWRQSEADSKPQLDALSAGSVELKVLEFLAS